MDLRTPIGYLFTLLGIILIAWGLLGGEQHLTKNGDNINLWWGIALLVFGLLMGFGAYRSARKAAARDGKSCGSGCGCSK